MQQFVYTGNSARVVFGSGTTQALPEEMARLGMRKALILTTPPQEDQGRALHDMIGSQSAGVYPHAAMHTPVFVTEKALEVFKASGADGVVAIGGGSTTGLSKAIALRTDVPQIILPTSYAGSEMTPIIGQTENGRKTTQRTLQVLPETVIYDVDHTMSLPVTMTVTSGMNAIAHAVEALYSEGANPILSLMAEDGITKMTSALKLLPEKPDDRTARHDALYGAWLCAVCLGSGGIALHHKICHVLGGSFDLPHAETHAVVLPHALAYNAEDVPEAMTILRRALGSETPAAALYDIARTGGAPTSLKELGMPNDGIDSAVKITLENSYPNPRPLVAGALHDTVRAAWEGTRPSV